MADSTRKMPSGLFTGPDAPAESELYKYAATLRSITQGRAHHSRTLAGYEPAPDHIAQKVRAEREAAEAS